MERAIQSLCFMADHRIDRDTMRVRPTFGKRIPLKQLDALLNSGILEILRETMHQEAVVFCLLVGFVIMTVYLTFYVLVNGLSGSRNSNLYTNEKIRR
ncbi:hypothetical protein ASG93_21915 [Paenibacillus sp. Soil787]|nr:hypothetical protein ASG93_21915 [Paenibacillus sp. Soil787]